MGAAGPATVYDELDELRAVLRSAEIAEAIGRRPETISRIRRGRPVSRRTERALDALHTVVTSVLERSGGDPAVARLYLFRRRPELGGRSAAELIRSGEVERVLEHATGPREDLRVPLELDATLGEVERGTPAHERPGAASVERFLGGYPGSSEVVELVAAAARRLFGSEVEIVLDVLSDVDSGTEELYVGIRSGLSVGVATERLRELYRECWDALAVPAADRLTVGLDFS